MANYSYTEIPTGVGLAVRFVGPGMSEFRTIHPHSTLEADSITSMLSAAYEAGRAARAVEIREALGIVDTPWGIKLK